MLLCCIALHANVVTGTCGDNLTWSYDTDTKALTIEGSGAMNDYNNSSSYQPWAQVRGDILSVSLPEGLTSIGSNAFYACSSLTSITLPNSVTSIGGNAFRECYALTSVTLGNSVTSIGVCAFYYCSSLTSITLPNSVTSIGESAFQLCSSLTSITIPNSVTTIGDRAFSSCAQVTVECTTPPTIESNTFKSNANICVPCSALDTYLQTTIWQWLDLKGLSHTINLSATEGGKATITTTDCDANTATIEAVADNLYQFSQWSDENTDNPRTLTLTQDTTFQAEFTPIPSYSVTLRGNSIEGYYQYIDNKGNIDYSWFGYDSEIINITVREGLSVYFSEKNMNCGTWLGWSDGVTDNERTITITSDTVITSLFDITTYQVNIYAAEHGSLTQYGEPIGNIVTTMTDCDSDGEWINNICAVPDDGYYFTGWSDGNADACRSIKVVSDTTLVAHFAEKQQVQVLVGVEPACKNMGTVSGSGIFYQGDVVTITAIPNSGYHFVEWSDGNSHATRDILLTSDTTLFATFSAGDFGGKCGDNLYWTWDNGALTITGSGDMDLFTYPAWWQYPIDIQSVSFPEAMTSISAYAFYGYNSYAVYQAPYSLKEAIIPANVTYIGYASFAECPQLTKWQYNGTQLEVQYAEGYDVFNGDAALTFLQAPAELVEYRNNSWSNLDTLIVISGEIGEVPSNVRYLDLRNATNSTLRLNGRENLTTLYLPNGYTEIADKALLGCKHLGGITIPADVTRIGESAFEDCRSMDSVVFAGNKVETIGDWAFYNCHSLRSLTLPEGIEEIGRAAFFDCTYLNELTLPSTMKKIADNGFAGCEKLGTMYVNDLVPPTIEAKTLEDVDRATPVFVPKGTIARYQADQYWSEFFNMAEYEAPTGNLSTSAEDNTNALRKVLRNGQVLILRGDKTYTILGEAL